MVPRRSGVAPVRGGGEKVGGHRQAHAQYGAADSQGGCVESQSQHTSAPVATSRACPTAPVRVARGSAPKPTKSRRTLPHRSPARSRHGLRQGHSEPGRGLGDADHEGRLEQQLQRCRRPMPLRRSPSAHHPPQRSGPDGISLAAPHVFLPRSVGVTAGPILPARPGRHGRRHRAGRSAQPAIGP